MILQDLMRLCGLKYPDPVRASVSPAHAADGAKPVLSPTVPAPTTLKKLLLYIVRLRMLVWCASTQRVFDARNRPLTRPGAALAGPS